jgi:hypothetical protein
MEIVTETEEPSGIIEKYENRKINGFFPDSSAYLICEVVDEDIICHGGSNRNKEFSQINIMNSLMMKWSSIFEISSVDPFFIFDKALSGHTSNLVKINNGMSIVVYGGFDGSFYSNAIYLIESLNFQFKQVDIRGKMNEYPQPRSSHTSCYDEENNCLYIYGGWNGNITTFMSKNFSNIWKFDLKCK